MIDSNDFSLTGTTINLKLDGVGTMDPTLQATTTVTINLFASCENTLLGYNYPSGLQIPRLIFDQGSNFPTTYFFDEFTDSISSFSGNKDGLTYCGPRKYTLIDAPFCLTSQVTGAQ